MNLKLRQSMAWSRERIAMLALVFVAACSGTDDGGPAGPSGPQDPPGSGEPPPQLVVAVEGRLERGMTVELSATRDGAPVAPATVTWSATPAGAAEFPSPGLAILRQSGSVQLRAETSGAAGTVTISVAAPPVIVFDMVAGGRRDVFRAALDGRDVLRLTQDGSSAERAAANQSRVFYSRYPGGQLHSVPLGGGSRTQVTPFGGVQDVSISPDGKRLAFARSSGEPAPKIWVFAVDGSGAHRATPQIGFAGAPEGTPSWAPDGKRIVYMSWHEGTAGLYLLDLDAGTAASLLVDPSMLALEPAWSPDGEWVAFASNMDGHTHIYRIHVETHEVERLTDGAEADGQPAWLPDGRLVFTSRSGEETRLRWLDPASPGEVFEIPLDGINPAHPAGVF